MIQADTTAPTTQPAQPDVAPQVKESTAETRVQQAASKVDDAEQMINQIHKRLADAFDIFDGDKTKTVDVKYLKSFFKKQKKIDR